MGSVQNKIHTDGIHKHKLVFRYDLQRLLQTLAPMDDKDCRVSSDHRMRSPTMVVQILQVLHRDSLAMVGQMARALLQAGHKDHLQTLGMLRLAGDLLQVRFMDSHQYKILAI